MPCYTPYTVLILFVGPLLLHSISSSRVNNRNVMYLAVRLCAFFPFLFCFFFTLTLGLVQCGVFRSTTLRNRRNYWDSIFSPQFRWNFFYWIGSFFVHMLVCLRLANSILEVVFFFSALCKSDQIFKFKLYFCVFVCVFAKVCMRFSHFNSFSFLELFFLP